MSKITLEPNASGAGTFSIVSPDSNTNRTLNLPDEAGTVLTNVSDIPVSNITGQIASLNMPAESVIQVVHNVDNSRRLFSGIPSNSWQSSYNNLDTTITPIFSNSKLLVIYSIHYGACRGDGSLTGSVFIRATRNGSEDAELNGGDGTSGYRCFSQFRSFNDVQRFHMNQGVLYRIIEPQTTNSLTFGMDFRLQNGGRFSINRDPAPSSDSSRGDHSPTGISTITLMELRQ